ncbi:hypothetical protein [Pyrobaculum aerophilum]|uniref:hypothetical protein n=1 Tax=Pyrobaculum aerophilum TaxID=13773 RepID=UPI0021613FDF|nr:hypothetical protein [Pyrobaculum aerophilum]
MELLAPLLITYTAVRIIANRGRWADVAYIIVLTYLSTVYTYAVIPLAVPYLLAIYAIRRGKLANYAGFGSALSFTGVIIMTAYANSPHLLALGFVMATLAPAVLLQRWGTGDR